MNVRITPRGAPQRTEIYGGIVRVLSDGSRLSLLWPTGNGASSLTVPLRLVAEIALDDDAGAIES